MPRKTSVRSSLIGMILLATSTAMATSSRVFVPYLGQTVTVDALRVDVLDVQSTHWTPPAGASVAHYAIVRVTDGGIVRTLTLSDTPMRLDVVKDHAIRLSDQPFGISVTPAPATRIDAIAAERIAKAQAIARGWSATSPSSTRLLFGRTWEISYQIAMDEDGVVQLDATTGRVLSASKSGGP